MTTFRPQRILIADDNPIVRETLAQWLRSEGHEVVTAETGPQAFLVLCDFGQAVDWLYARAALPGLIDGCILADAYHDRHKHRPVILAGTKSGMSSQGDLVLDRPTPAAVFDALRRALASGKAATFVAVPTDARKAA
jgi:CheY-like chemotaxis protein